MVQQLLSTTMLPPQKDNSIGSVEKPQTMESTLPLWPTNGRRLGPSTTRHVNNNNNSSSSIHGQTPEIIREDSNSQSLIKRYIFSDPQLNLEYDYYWYILPFTIAWWRSSRCHRSYVQGIIVVCETRIRNQKSSSSRRELLQAVSHDMVLWRPREVPSFRCV